MWHGLQRNRDGVVFKHCVRQQFWYVQDLSE